MKQTSFFPRRFSDMALIGLLLAGAIGYRILLAHLTFKTIIFDMNEFTVFAQKMLQGKWLVDCCDRTLGYSVLLAGIYRLFGDENVMAVQGVNIAIDIISAVLIFQVARRVFSRSVAWIAFLLALFNPFTASYTGLLLSETLTVFWVVVIAWIVTHPRFRIQPRLWFSLGVSLGLLVFTKMAYHYVAFSLPLVLAVFAFKRYARIFFFSLAVTGVMVGSLYTLANNLVSFHVISLVPPYNMSYGGLYLNFYHGSPMELARQFHQDPVYTSIYWEYYGIHLGDHPVFQEKYKQLFLEKMKTDWPLFLSIVLKNTWWIWDKEHLGAIYDDWYPADLWPLRIFNGVLLGFFFYGLIQYICQDWNHRWRHPLVLVTVVLFCHITFLFPLVSNESRHSIPFYGLLFLWAAFGAVQIVHRVRSLHSA